MGIKLTDEQIKQIREYRRQKKTLGYIADIMEVNKSTVFSYTKDIVIESEQKRYIFQTVIELLEQGKNIEEAAFLGNVTVAYVRKIIRTKRIKEYKGNEIETDRQKEVREICEEVEKMNLNKEKEWTQELEREKQYYKERYEGFFKI